MNILLFVVLSIVKVLVVVVILLMAVAYTVLLERKVVGRIQNRWGPSRVGPFGLLQPLADGAKLFLKEDIIPDGVYRPALHRRADHFPGLRAALDFGGALRPKHRFSRAWISSRSPTSTSA